MGEKKGKNTVFYVSLIIVGIIAVWSVAFNDSFTVVANAAFKVLTTDFGWLYLISMIIFFGFIVYFAFGKYGKALFEVFKYIGVPVEEIGYNQPKGVRYLTENPW